MSSSSIANILGNPIHCTSYEAATTVVLTWANHSESRYVCLANTHMLMEAHDDQAFRGILAASDLNCPDGMPLVWVQRALGYSAAQRVRGADLMLAVCASAAKAGISVGLYGGRPEVLDKLAVVLNTRFRDLDIGYRYAPPFRALTEEEDAEQNKIITRSGVRILFVGLGCPKQERWMFAHRGLIPTTMLGVGAAFDMHAGELAQAPSWVQAAGLEWLDRLAREPRRLMKRYIRNNPRFLALALMQLVLNKEIDP